MATATARPVQPSISETELFASEKTVAQKVLDTFGKIENFSNIRCVRVFDSHYRVNIFCERKGDGEFISDIFIAHSYFLTVGSDGTVLYCESENGSKPLVFLKD